MAHAFWHLGGGQPRQNPTTTGPAYQPGFWETLGRTQLPPQTQKILGDQREELAEEGLAIEAQRKEGEMNRMLASTRYISPEMESAMRQGTVAKEYAPPKEDDDWFKKMMQLSFMQSMMPELEGYSGTSTVQVGPAQRDFYDIPYYGSPYPGGTNV